MTTDKRGLLHGETTHRVVAAFYEVYDELGPGFVESVYAHAMRRALACTQLHFETEVPVTVWFRRQPLVGFRADLVVERTVLVELKAASGIDPVHRAQVLNYLRSSELEVGLLLNFGPKAQFERFILTNSRKRSFHAIG